MTAFARVFRLGTQPVPSFANTATLMQHGFTLDELDLLFTGTPKFPEAAPGSPFNVACLGFLPREGGRGGGTVRTPMSYSFWSNRILAGVRNIFGTSKVVVPPWAEYFKVCWLAPPVNFLADGVMQLRPVVNPEDFFMIRWELTT